MDQALSAPFNRLFMLEKGPEKFLSIQSDRNSACLSDPIKISGHKLIGQFSITKDRKYNEGHPKISKLISAEEMRTLDGTFLGTGYSEAVLMDVYNIYHELKEKYFLQWLVQG